MKIRHFVKVIGLLYLLLGQRQILASHELNFQVANFSSHAHRMMNDHGTNALYSIRVIGVRDFLPKKYGIKRLLIKLIDDRLIPGKSIVKMARHHFLTHMSTLRFAPSREFFNAFREDHPYTFVISSSHLFITESTNIPKQEKYKNGFSKHYLISNCLSKVYFAGEIHVYKNKTNNEVFLVFDNASGTYKPSVNFLPSLKKLLDYNFFVSGGGMYFVAKSFNQKINKEKLFAHDIYPFEDDPTAP